MKNIIICGFMGSGKSVVGEALASRLRCGFIDMDDYIETREGMKIPEIFEKFGEESFREREHNAILELAGMKGFVISSGGGALMRAENTEALRESGSIVFLDVDFDECYSRIKKSDRPLVKKNSREGLERIYYERAAVYRRAADIEIKAVGNPDEIAGMIMERLCL